MEWPSDSTGQAESAESLLVSHPGGIESESAFHRAGRRAERTRAGLPTPEEYASPSTGQAGQARQAFCFAVWGRVWPQYDSSLAQIPIKSGNAPGQAYLRGRQSES